ncbi:hypothetical protein GCM10022393_27060 [Aquimarina addita]|uniref:Gp5/Type VI secretion system Vgr protein OB-fold domain-containing protein n=1 Tax=Aquimarina addita TaxID=870485 RepID=A0ABP6UQV2_9FLAO
MNLLGDIEEKTGIVTSRVFIEGSEVSTLYGVQSIGITNACNRIPTAILTIIDGSPADQDFKASSDAIFEPGKAIEIKAGYQGIEATVFKGIIIKQAIKITKKNSVLIVTCKDDAFTMTLGKKNNIFYDATDSDAIEKLINDAGLTPNVIATTFTHHELVQYQSTDWDFMMSRAQVNGAICTISDGTIHIQKPVLNDTEVMTATFGSSIFSFDAEIDARHQYQSYEANSWDYSNQEIISTTATNAGQISTGNLTESSLAKAAGNHTTRLDHSGNISSEVLQTWVDSKSTLQQLAMIRGTLQVQGNKALKAGVLIKLEGVGDRFNGKVFVGGVHHTITEGNWFTNVQIGLDPDWFTEQYDISALPASGMLPAISGLQIGVVTALEGDPDSEHRIKVKVPIINTNEEGVWARVLSLYAGENYGVQFLPEIGNEVLLGFLNDDPTQAVVLGAMYSNTHTAPIEFTDDNFEKIIMGNSEIKILLNDDTKTITLETPAGKSIMLDEDEGIIKLEDDNNNIVTLNSDGISLESGGDITLKATGDVTIEGNNIEAKANMNFKAEGSAGIEVSSSATAVLKGSLVQIN